MAAPAGAHRRWCEAERRSSSDPGPGTIAAASLYQRLRNHLAELKLHDAARINGALLVVDGADDLLPR